jgi:hypothetical protein
VTIMTETTTHRIAILRLRSFPWIRAPRHTSQALTAISKQGQTKD